MNWRTIESAPRDGTVVFIRSDALPRNQPEVMFWNAGRHWWEGVYLGVMGPITTRWDANVPEQPTHWCPLPEPPEATA